MRRFFFHPDNRKGEIVDLSAEESKHASKVLRLPIGTSVELLDGMGTLFSGEIVQSGKLVRVKILEEIRVSQDKGKKLVVYQGILKGEKMDTVVQKCTELGVDQMVPFHSSRCQGKLVAAQAAKKYERWRRISLAACKQCYRLVPLDLAIPGVYPDIITSGNATGDNRLKLIFWEEERDNHLHDIKGINEAASIELLLGPEGGLTEEEVVAARSFGWCSVSLGSRILRAETATLTAVSVVQYLLGRL